jgi:hypothetical protein
MYVTLCGHRPYKDKNVAHPAVRHEEVAPTAQGHDSRYSVTESSGSSRPEGGTQNHMNLRGWTGGLEPLQVRRQSVKKGRAWVEAEIYLV